MQLIKSSPTFAGWITAELGKIAVMFGEEISAQRLALMVTALMEIEPDELRGAFERAPRELKFFPKPAEILALAKSERARKAVHERQPATREDRQWITEQLEKIAALTNERKMTLGKLHAIADELTGIDRERLRWAFWRAGHECTRFPSLAEILERLPRAKDQRSEEE
jgi:hypothetical protein